MSTRFHIFERVSIFSPLNTHSQKGARATRRIIQRSNSNNTSFILSTRRGNCRASISRKNVPFSRVEYMYILLVEHQLKETAQRRRDKAIDCNAIAREYKRRERERERDGIFFSRSFSRGKKTLQKKSNVVITGRRTRGIGIKLQRNDIFFFFFFLLFLLLFPFLNSNLEQIDRPGASSYSVFIFFRFDNIFVFRARGTRDFQIPLKYCNA